MYLLYADDSGVSSDPNVNFSVLAGFATFENQTFWIQKAVDEIMMKPDHIEIVSYGGLIDGMSREELISGCSRPRNREIMRIFKDVDLVEQLGTGMEKMLTAYTPDSARFPNLLVNPRPEKMWRIIGLRSEKMLLKA
ncbi:hypothetical protein J5690_00270 [bacterium]|nr:hypothetical protein [bacterium]